MLLFPCPSSRTTSLMGTSPASVFLGWPRFLAFRTRVIFVPRHGVYVVLILAVWIINTGAVFFVDDRAFVASRVIVIIVPWVKLIIALAGMIVYMLRAHISWRGYLLLRELVISQVSIENRKIML